jgi:DNA-binding YbaB/EbfC family protein
MSQGNLSDMLRNVTRLRKDLDKVQEGLKAQYVEAHAGGDLVDVTLNGRQELVKLHLNPKLFEGAKDGKLDLGLVEDLILAAVSQGMEKSKALMRQEMEKVSGGMGIGGMFPGLFG